MSSAIKLPPKKARVIPCLWNLSLSIVSCCKKWQRLGVSLGHGIATKLPLSVSKTSHLAESITWRQARIGVFRQDSCQGIQTYGIPHRRAPPVVGGRSETWGSDAAASSWQRDQPHEPSIGLNRRHQRAKLLGISQADAEKRALSEAVRVPTELWKV